MKCTDSTKIVLVQNLHSIWVNLFLIDVSLWSSTNNSTASCQKSENPLDDSNCGHFCLVQLLRCDFIALFSPHLDT